LPAEKNAKTRTKAMSRLQPARRPCGPKKKMRAAFGGVGGFTVSGRVSDKRASQECLLHFKRAYRRQLGSGRRYGYAKGFGRDRDGVRIGGLKLGLQSFLSR
jgi:hypothetical protein